MKDWLECRVILEDMVVQEVDLSIELEQVNPTC